MSATKKEGKYDTSIEQSNFMSKISHLQSSSSALGGLSDSKLSSRLSTQSKQRLVAIKSNGRQAQYAKFYKDIAINKDKVNEDEKWLEEKIKDVKGIINQSEISIYGKGLIKIEESIIHAFLYANLAEKVGKNDFESLKNTQTHVNMEIDQKQKTVSHIFES